MVLVTIVDFSGVVEFGEQARAIQKLLIKHNVDAYIIRPRETLPMDTTHLIITGEPSVTSSAVAEDVPSTDALNVPSRTSASTDALTLDPLRDTTLPVLGIGFGAILIARMFGALITDCAAEIDNVDVVEFDGLKQVRKPRAVNRRHRILALDSSRKLWKQGVVAGDDVVAFSDYKQWTGVQYHPEAHSDYSVFARFLAPASRPARL